MQKCDFIKVAKQVFSCKFTAYFLDIASHANNDNLCSVLKNHCNLETKLQKASSVELFKLVHENGMKAS